jgi:hypothetical protein
MQSVYKLRVSYEDELPDFDLSSFDGDWEQLLSNTSPLELVSTAPDSDCEFYLLAGTLGVASNDLASRLLQWSGAGLRGRPVLVDQRGFQILLVAEPLDALDLQLSDYTVFRPNPQRVKQIRSFVFKVEAIPTAPLVFTIPQSRSTLLANEAAVDLLRQNNHPGLDFDLVWEA